MSGNYAAIALDAFDVKSHIEEKLAGSQLPPEKAVFLSHFAADIAPNDNPILIAGRRSGIPLMHVKIR